jgi:hypothetical protein
MSSLSPIQSRLFGALLLMAVAFLVKDLLFQWLWEHVLFAVYGPPAIAYAGDLGMDSLFLFEGINFLLGITLISSLRQATGLLPRVVRGMTYLILAMYLVGVAVSFLPALLPGPSIG